MADRPPPTNARYAAEISADAKTLIRAHQTTPNPRASKVAFWELDVDSNALTWSDDMTLLFGVDPSAADVRGFDAWAAWRSAIHPDDLPAAERSIRLAARDAAPIAVSFRVVLASGAVRWIEADGEVVCNREGKAVRILGSCRDVSRQRQAERDMASRRQHLEASLAERTSELDVAVHQLERTAYDLTENIPVGTYTFVKRPGERLPRFEFMSRRFLELQDIDRETLAADPRNGMGLLHPEEAEEWVRRSLDALDREVSFRGEARFLVKGEYRWIAVESIPRSLPDGTVIWEGVLTDVTDRKLAEQRLAESEARYRLLADNCADVIWLMDLDPIRFTYVSPSVERLRGFTAEEVLQQAPEEMMTPESYRRVQEELPRRLAALAAGDETVRTTTTEIVQPRKDGTLVVTEATTTLLAEPGCAPTTMLGISRDITARKAAEAELAAARAREKDLEERMRAILERKLRTSLNAAAVAHEINQPLSRILLRARMDLERPRGERDDMLRALIDDAERVVSTIDKMKVLLRNVEAQQEDVDLGPVLASALNQLKTSLRTSGATVTWTGPTRGRVVRGDAVQLKMVFLNLIQNAIEAVGQAPGGRKEIVVELRALDAAVEAVVGDSGPGWPGGTLDEMLLNTSKPGGSGVGLYVVKTAVENHRGQIAIGRSPLGGAEFRIAFTRRSDN